MVIPGRPTLRAGVADVMVMLEIVEGAVMMVREAVAQLEERTTEAEVIPLDADRKATRA